MIALTVVVTTKTAGVTAGRTVGLPRVRRHCKCNNFCGTQNIRSARRYYILLLCDGFFFSAVVFTTIAYRFVYRFIGWPVRVSSRFNIKTADATFDTSRIRHGENGSRAYAYKKQKHSTHHCETVIRITFFRSRNLKTALGFLFKTPVCYYTNLTSCLVQANRFVCFFNIPRAMPEYTQQRVIMHTIYVAQYLIEITGISILYSKFVKNNSSKIIY